MIKVNGTRLSLVVAAAIFSAASVTADDLGTIKVESSTININESEATEVSTVNYIDNKQIQEIGPKQINEVLQTIPGVTADVRPGEVVEIHIRGMNQQEFMWEDTGVAIIIDGVPVYAKSGKFRLNMSDIKSIKVIKGSASYLYGNNATAGAVIITTSKPKGDKSSYSVSAEAGSNNYKDYSADVYNSTDNYAFNLNANYRKTDGYWIDSALLSKSFGGKFSYYINNSSDITFGVDKTKKFEQASRAGVTGVTEAEENPRGTQNDPFQKDNDVVLDKYFMTYSVDITNDSNLIANVYDYIDEYDYISSPQDTNLDGIADAYSNHSLEYKKQKGLKLEYKQSINSFAFMLGYEYGKRKYTTGSETLVDYLYLGRDGVIGGTGSNADVQKYAGNSTESEDNQKLNAYYGELKYAITPKFTTTFNIRRDIQNNEWISDSRNYDGTTWINTLTQIDKTFTNDAYRAGAAYSVSDKNSIFGNIATGYRTPTVDKIQTNIDNGVTNDIKTQKSITYEIGTRGVLPIADNFLDYEISIFQMDTKDIIGYEDGTYSMSVGGSSITTNIGDSRNRGLEVSLKSDSSKDLSFNLAYTYLKAEYTKHNLLSYSRGTLIGDFDVVGNELPRTPNHMLDIYTTYKATSDLRFISEIYAKSKYYADETNQIEMPGYAYMNLQARYNTNIRDHKFEFFVKVNNIFDKQYYKTAYFTSDRSGDGTFDNEDPTITVDPGREYYAGIKYTF
jgi:iron complex outermembrane receptor protein